jgi:broad specificity phosphatase PhoE
MKPKRIFLVRHGQSTGNVDKNVYKDVPDYALTLTDLGREQARNVGKELKSIIGNESVHFYVSPFWRTRQTYLGILQSFGNHGDFGYYEDARLREQEWGQNMETREGYKEKIEEYRDAYGHFYYRFRDGGESCADVFDRSSDMINTVHRDFEKVDFPQNAIFVKHGMSIRCFVMRWFHKSVEEFESWANPKNCGYILLQLNSKTNKYELMTEMKTHELSHEWQFDWEKFKGLASK